MTSIFLCLVEEITKEKEPVCVTEDDYKKEHKSDDASNKKS